MEKDYSIFFQLIRLGLGISDEAVVIPMEAWKGLYKEAERQSMLGVVFEGVNRNVNLGGTKPPICLGTEMDGNLAGYQTKECEV